PMHEHAKKKPRGTTVATLATQPQRAWPRSLRWLSFARHRCEVAFRQTETQRPSRVRNGQIQNAPVTTFVTTQQCGWTSIRCNPLQDWRTHLELNQKPSDP